MRTSLLIFDFEPVAIHAYTCPNMYTVNDILIILQCILDEPEKAHFSKSSKYAKVTQGKQ
jgi:hypothetical protein